jgi:hypothetical protein
MQLLNVIGILFNLTGAVIIFYNTPRHHKQISFREEEELTSILRRERNQRKLFKIGVLLLCLGFTFQAVSAIILQSVHE